LPWGENSSFSRHPYEFQQKEKGENYEETGTCVQEGDQLVLRPDHPPEGRGGRQNQQDSYKK